MRNALKCLNCGVKEKVSSWLSKDNPYIKNISNLLSNVHLESFNEGTLARGKLQRDIILSYKGEEKLLLDSQVTNYTDSFLMSLDYERKFGSVAYCPLVDTLDYQSIHAIVIEKGERIPEDILYTWAPHETLSQLGIVSDGRAVDNEGKKIGKNPLNKVINFQSSIKKLAEVVDYLMGGKLGTLTEEEIKLVDDCVIGFAEAKASSKVSNGTFTDDTAKTCCHQIIAAAFAQYKDMLEQKQLVKNQFGNGVRGHFKIHEKPLQPPVWDNIQGYLSKDDILNVRAVSKPNNFNKKAFEEDFKSWEKAGSEKAKSWESFINKTKQVNQEQELGL